VSAGHNLKRRTRAGKLRVTQRKIRDLKDREEGLSRSSLPEAHRGKERSLMGDRRAVGNAAAVLQPSYANVPGA